MGRNKRSKDIRYPPTIFNVFKPARISSYDVIRHFKRHLPEGYGKIGHFGTLDPFASGVLLIGIANASRLNDYIHEELPKTYLAIGKLGVKTVTGDLTEGVDDIDDTDYFHREISRFTPEFIEDQLRSKFLGEYWQAPPAYSATKFQGRPLHQWAREGVIIKKESVRREVLDLRVCKFAFPYLSLRIQVSSGTYIRTLFEDCAKHFGTYGALVSLVRESIGHLNVRNSLKKNSWPNGDNWNLSQYGLSPADVLQYDELLLNPDLAAKFSNGVQLNGFSEYSGKKLWVKDNERVLGLVESNEDGLKTKFVFPSFKKNDLGPACS